MLLPIIGTVLALNSAFHYPENFQGVIPSNETYFVNSEELENDSREPKIELWGWGADIGGNVGYKVVSKDLGIAYANMCDGNFDKGGYFHLGIGIMIPAYDTEGNLLAAVPCISNEFISSGALPHTVYRNSDSRVSATPIYQLIFED